MAKKNILWHSELAQHVLNRVPWAPQRIPLRPPSRELIMFVAENFIDRFFLVEFYRPHGFLFVVQIFFEIKEATFFKES